MNKLKSLFAFPIIVMDLSIHTVDPNTNVTTDSGLAADMHTFYSDYLIDFAETHLIHDQFAQQHPIPQGKGKTINFRKKVQWNKLTTALSEGVTPDGQSLSWTYLEATVAQYGGYATISDMLDLTATDDNILYATELCGDQAGRTLDTITREVLNGGTNVQYASGQVTARYKLVGGDATAANNHYLTVKAIRKAVRTLKGLKASKVDGKNFVALIHTDVVYDIQEDEKWVDVKTYSDPENIYNGEIGRLYGVRFVESTECKVFHAEDLVATGGDNDARTLTVASYNAGTKTVTIDEALSAADALALADRDVIIDGELSTIASAAAGAAGAATITLEDARTEAPADGDVVYPGEAGAAGRDVYSTLVLGKDAYGVTEVKGGGLQIFVKQLGSAGTADPLNQRATVGWKATKVAKRLVEDSMVRIETTSDNQYGEN